MTKMITWMAAGAISGATFSASAEELRMVGAFPENFIFTTEVAVPFMELVKEETDGRLTLSLTGPDAVPPLEQFEPVQAGVFDLLFTHPAYHAGATPLGLTIDAIAADPEARREAGVIDYIDSHYRETQGMALLTAPIHGSVGFRFYLRDPIADEPAFDGRNIRGTVSYHPMIEALGGSGVVMGGGEVYSSLQTGAIDGAAWGTTGALDFKWNEVAGYMSEPAFGQVGTMVFMNLESWNKLSQDDQAALRRAALRLEAETLTRFDELAVTERAGLLEAGVQVTKFSAADAERLESLWSGGVWQIGEKGDAATVGPLRELAASAGLTR